MAPRKGFKSSGGLGRKSGRKSTGGGLGRKTGTSSKRRKR